MKKVVFLILTLSTLMLTGCDTFRRIAGRPTSEDIRNKRLEILAQEARQDSLKRAQADSLALADSLQQAHSLKNVKDFGELYSGDLDCRYYIVVGAFRDSRNFERMVRTVSDAGYEPTKIIFRNGLQAVAVKPENELRQAFYALRSVRLEDFCPPDVWILVNK